MNNQTLRQDSQVEQLEGEQLTPAQIDARHTRHLLERALAQLERGERPEASLSCRQALHLAPHCALAHSVEGLLALLQSDWKLAAEAYEKAVENFGEGSVERARLVMLRSAQATRVTPTVSALLPNVSGEIVRLRAAIHAAPDAAFLNDLTGEAPARHPGSVVAPAVAAPVAPANVSAILELGPPPRARRASTPLLNAVIAALAAALVSFLIVRALRSGETTSMPAPNAGAPTSNAVANDPAAPPLVSNAAPGNASNPTATTSPAPAPAPAATPVVPSAAPASGASNPARSSSPAIRSSPARSGSASPAPARAAPVAARPTLPQPTPSTPRPTPVPAEPAMPPMPPPRVVLPSAGHAPPEYPRVSPSSP
jgi:hypothetical protein